MALTTKLNLINAKFYQQDGGLLTLSGDTRIHDVGTLQYTSNQSGSYVARSVPDVAYVTGLTGNLDGRIDLLEAWSATTETRVDNLEADVNNLATWSGTTNNRLTNVEADINNLAVWSGTTQNAIDALEADVDNLAVWSGTTNNRLTNVEADINNLAVWSGTTQNAIDALEADVDNLAAWSGATQAVVAVAITGVTNGLTKVGAHSAKLGGQLTETTTVYGSQTLNFNVNTVNITGYTGGIRLSGVTYIAPMAGTGNLLCFDTTTGQVGRTSLSAFGGITGGTNGITDVGDYNLGLGGALCDDTTICGANRDLVLGTVASKLDCFCVNAATVCLATNSLSISSSGATFNDLCSTPHGIIYGGDYSANFCNDSLVSKKYVDTVATGLIVHNSVCAATTVGQNLDLSGAETIDGITTTNGMRILVKNQTLAWQNGIYTASASTWTRSTDMDFTPPGEVTNGDLVPVTSGSTQNNSIWVVTSPNPIVSGDTITFTQFSTVIDLQGGAGVDITQVGGLHTVCVNLGGAEPTSCGLSVGVGGLCVDPNIAGRGLSYSAGVINADVISGGTISSIPVRYNAGDTQLVINCADITAAVGALTGAESGLHVTSGCKVALGGILTGATTITGNDTCTLTYTDTAITNKRGILYGGDYETTFVSRSLVTAKYVTGLTSGLDARLDVIEPIYVTGATNGLTKFGAHVVCLGGTLSSDAEINGNDAYCFSFGNSTSLTKFEANVNNEISLATTAATLTIVAQPNEVRILADAFRISGVPNGTILDSVLVWNSSTCEIDQISVSDITGSTTISATNGLSVNAANQVVLGGTLTGNTTINLSGRTLCLAEGTSEYSFSCSCVCLTVSAGGALQMDGNADSITLITNAGNTSIVLNGATDVVTTTTTGGACSVINGTSKIFCFDSTGAGNTYVEINGSASDFIVLSTNSGNTAIEANGVSDYVSMWTTGGAFICAVGTNDTIDLNNAGGAYVLLTGSTVTIDGTIKIVDMPAAGNALDSVLVRDSVTGAIQAVSGSALGDHNNIYSYTAVTGTVTLTTGSSYVILATAPATITLPSPAQDGQVFKIKDAAGTALTTNISIVGTIDGAANALINTNYGALELMYSGGAWYSMAFIN
jgi:hypothetical protein